MRDHTTHFLSFESVTLPSDDLFLQAKNLLVDLSIQIVVHLRSRFSISRDKRAADRLGDVPLNQRGDRTGEGSRYVGRDVRSKKQTFNLARKSLDTNVTGQYAFQRYGYRSLYLIHGITKSLDDLRVKSSSDLVLGNVLKRG